MSRAHQADRTIMIVADHLPKGGQAIFTNCPDGLDALVIADLARALARQAARPPRALLHIARDGAAIGRARGGARASSPRRSRCCPSRPGIASPMIASRPMPPSWRDAWSTLSRLATTHGRRPAAHRAHHRQCGPAARAGARPRRRPVPVGRARQCGQDGRSGALAGEQWLYAHLDGARDRRICRARRHPRSLPARPRHAGPARLLRRHARIDPQLRSGDAAHRGAASHARPRAGQRGAADDRDDQALPPGLSRRVRRADPRATRSTRRSPKAGAIPGSSTGCRCSMQGSIRCSTISTACRSRSTPSPRTQPASGSPRSRIITTPGATRSARRGRARPTSPWRPTGSISRRRNGGAASTRRRWRASRRSPSPRRPGAHRRLRRAAGPQLRGRARGRGRQRLRRRRRATSASGRRRQARHRRRLDAMARASASAPCSPTTA